MASQAAPTPISRRARQINIGAAALALVWVLVIFATLDPNVDDFRQYWQAGINLRATGNAYATTPVPGAPREALGGPAYPNPPLFAWLVSPLSRLPYPGARAAWFWMNTAMLAALIAACVSLSASARARRYWGAVGLATVIAPPTRLSLQLGQVSILLALLVVGSAWLVRRPARPGAGWRRAALSGTAVGIATAIKLYPGLLIVYYALRERRLGLACVGATALVGALSLLTMGLGQHAIYLRDVVLGGYYPYQAEFNISWLSFWMRLLTPSTFAVPLAVAPQLATLLALICCAATLLACLAVMRAGAAHEAAAFSVWVCAMLLLSPVNGYYNLVALLLPVLVLADRIESGATSRRRAAGVLALALCCIPPGWTNVHPDVYQAAHIGWGLLALTPSLYGLALLTALLAHSIGRGPGDRAPQGSVARQVPEATAPADEPPITSARRRLWPA